jgi:hypothetical protein
MKVKEESGGPKFNGSCGVESFTVELRHRTLNERSELTALSLRTLNLELFGARRRSPMPSFDEWFQSATGNCPFPFQRRFGNGRPTFTM